MCSNRLNHLHLFMIVRYASQEAPTLLQLPRCGDPGCQELLVGGFLVAVEMDGGGVVGEGGLSEMSGRFY
jgi:hypothetical protein